MNRWIRKLADKHSLDSEKWFDLRLQFSMNCVERTRHLIENSRAQELYILALNYPAGVTRDELAEAAKECSKIAASHQGNSSNTRLDGSGHAAVSATQGLAHALHAEAWLAAEYTGYAKVYSYSPHAVTQPAAFAEEYAWQYKTLQQLLKLAGITSEAPDFTIT
ncbi:MAG: hypothetical protein KTR32_21625 [Granulosicoccus sp.]|nr:hypothetical protein [Granulosicoccus sp.]